MIETTRMVTQTTDLRPDHRNVLDDLAQRAMDLAAASRAENTRRAYRSDWADFAGWCGAHGLSAMPVDPGDVGLYLADKATRLSMASLTRRLSAIAVAHRLAGHPLDTKTPAIRDVMKGLRREKGVAGRQVRPLTAPLARKIVETCGDTLIDARDRALVLIGLAGAFRRSELVALDVTDLVISDQGVRINIRRSKGDQDGEGAVIGVMRTGAHTCPVSALEHWLAAAAIDCGRVFRAVTRHGGVGPQLSGDAVARIVQRRAGLAGLDAASFSGHSMRAGFATAASLAGVAEADAMRQTRHRSVNVFRRYVRHAEVFKRNLSLDIGL